MLYRIAEPIERRATGDSLKQPRNIQQRARHDDHPKYDSAVIALCWSCRLKAIKPTLQVGEPIEKPGPPEDEDAVARQCYRRATVIDTLKA
jgi:hypothetical protein